MRITTSKAPHRRPGSTEPASDRDCAAKASPAATQWNSQLPVGARPPSLGRPLHGARNMPQILIPPAEGRAIHVAAARQIRIATPKGAQAADFFAFNRENIEEWLSPNHSWVSTRHVRPRQGDTLLSRFRRAMLDFVEDGAGGVHDMMIAACDQFRYEQFGYRGNHPSCSGNLETAMRRLGFQITVIPQPINFFTCTKVLEDGKFVSPPNPVPPGAYVMLKARMDLICVVSSCPFDLPIEDWTINAKGGPTELLVEVS
jgi:uncharacterized protein